MVHKIIEVNVLLEVVPPSVRHDSPIDCMDLPNGPRIKPRLWKELLHQVVATYLDIASPET